MFKLLFLIQVFLHISSLMANLSENIFCQSEAGNAVERGSVICDCEKRQNAWHVGYIHFFHSFIHPPNKQVLRPALVPGTGAIGVAGQTWYLS